MAIPRLAESPAARYVERMAGGKLAAEVACATCLIGGRDVVRAERFYEGLETDQYRCKKGHEFAVVWREPLTEPQWPLSAALLACLER